MLTIEKAGYKFRVKVAEFRPRLTYAVLCEDIREANQCVAHYYGPGPCAAGPVRCPLCKLARQGPVKKPRSKKGGSP